MKEYFPRREEVLTTNWLDTKNTPKNSPIPDYISRVRNDVRAVLRHVEDFPEFAHYASQISTTDTLFEAGRDSVLDRLCEDPENIKRIITTLQELNQGSEFSAETFSPEEIEDLMRSRSFDALQGRVSPDAWRYWSMVGAEIQYAQMTVLRKWIKEDQDCKAKVQTFGVDPDHLIFILQLGGVFGKRIDQAFFKQLQLHDTAKEARTEATDSSKFGYEIDNEVLPFSKIFSSEFQAMDIKKIDIPQDIKTQYPIFARYIEKLSEAFRSEEVDQNMAQKMWDNVFRLSAEAYQAGCPIFVTPYAVPGETGKVEIELRIGIREPQYDKAKERIERMHQSVQSIFDNYKKDDGTITRPTIAPTLLPSSLLGFGVSNSWYLDAENNSQRVILHPNVVDRIGIDDATENYFEIPDFDLRKFQDAALVEVASHEDGHGVYSWEDPEVVKRIGLNKNPVDAWSLEETKADLMGAKAILSDWDQMTEEQQTYQVAAKIGLITFLITQKKEEGGGRYFNTAAVLLDTLHSAGAISLQENGKISVSDAKKFFEALAERGEEIVKKYYQNPAGENTAADFMEEIRSVLDDANVTKYIDAIGKIYRNRLQKSSQTT